MTNITVSVNTDLKKRMEEHPEINWSEVARQAFQQKINDLDIMDEIASKSELTEEDVREISEQIDRNAADQLVHE
jgi:hypothetical protein